MVVKELTSHYCLGCVAAETEHKPVNVHILTFFTGQTDGLVLEIEDCLIFH